MLVVAFVSVVAWCCPLLRTCVVVVGLVSLLIVGRCLLFVVIVVAVLAVVCQCVFVVGCWCFVCG